MENVKIPHVLESNMKQCLMERIGDFLDDFDYDLHNCGLTEKQHRSKSLLHEKMMNAAFEVLKKGIKKR